MHIHTITRNVFMSSPKEAVDMNKVKVIVKKDLGFIWRAGTKSVCDLKKVINSMDFSLSH